MKRRIALLLFVILPAALAGCKKAPSDQEAIRVAVEKHLAGRANLNRAGMDMQVKQVNVQGNQATAEVEFRAHQGGGAVTVNYQLERQGKEWVVKGSQAGPGMTHPGMGAGSMPSTMPSGQLPPGHPPITQQPSQTSPPKKP